MGTKTIGTRTIRFDADSFAVRGRRVRGVRARESRRDSSPRSANSTPPPRRPPPPPRRIFRTNAPFSDPAAEYAAARATVSGAYRESVARLLTTMTGRRGAGGAAARAAMGDVPVAHALLALAGSSLPRVTSLAVLRAVASLSRDASAAASMRRAGAVPKLARFLQWEDPETRDVAFRALRNVCASSRAGAEQAAVAGAVPHLVAIAAPEPEVADRSGNNAEDADVSDAGRDSHAETTRRGVLGANGDGAHWLRGGDGVARSQARARGGAGAGLSAW